LTNRFHYENQFDLVPGTYTLDVAYDAGEKSRGKVTTPLKIDAYHSKDFALSGLALSRQYGPASDPRLLTNAAWLADRAPLIAAGMRIVPSGSNRFGKEQAPAVYGEVYEPLMSTPDSTSKLRVGIGIRIFARESREKKVDTGILPLDLPRAQSGPVVPFARRLPIDSLGPGSYLVEVEAGDTAGRTVRRYVDLEID